MKKAEETISRVLSINYCKATIYHNHLSWTKLTFCLQQFTSSRPDLRPASELQLLFNFAPNEACNAVFVAKNPVGSYPAISPLPCGGILSVALSVAFPLQKSPRLLAGIFSEGARTFLCGKTAAIISLLPELTIQTVRKLNEFSNRSSYSSKPISLISSRERCSSSSNSSSSFSSSSSLKSSSRSARLPVSSRWKYSLSPDSSSS